ncbi:hypothetical protein [Mycetocola sp. BIGb0189]|uniref:hypothetical protein n=1 Tax=Mycetocola sp. BIGb0189 TaxID=2940604 RepID=UPI00216A1D5C|nr:hypothetical protein [Mycetocola sp. BIGb0189]
MYKIVSALTHLPVATVQPKAGSFTRTINAVSTGSATFDVDDVHDWTRLTAPWEMIVVAEYNGVVMYAGYIIDDVYDAASRTIVVKTECVRTILSRRLPFAVTGSTDVPEYPAGTLSVVNKSWVGATRAILLRQVIGGQAGRWNLPIILPGDSDGGFSRTFWNYEFWTIEQMLAEIQNADGGPDIDFAPRWSPSGRLEWALVVGTPRISAGLVEWHKDAPAGGIAKFTRQRNGQKTLSGVHTIGKGSEQDMRYGKYGTEGPPGTIFLDGSMPYKEMDDYAQLNAQAKADAITFGRITEQWSFAINGGQKDLPSITDIKVGMTAGMRVSEDPVIPPGMYSQYVISFGCDLTDSVSLEVQAIGPN